MRARLHARSGRVRDAPATLWRPRARSWRPAKHAQGQRRGGGATGAMAGVPDRSGTERTHASAHTRARRSERARSDWSRRCRAVPAVAARMQRGPSALREPTSPLGADAGFYTCRGIVVALCIRLSPTALSAPQLSMGRNALRLGRRICDWEWFVGNAHEHPSNIQGRRRRDQTRQGADEQGACMMRGPGQTGRRQHARRRAAALTCACVARPQMCVRRSVVALAVAGGASAFVAMPPLRTSPARCARRAHAPAAHAHDITRACHVHAPPRCTSRVTDRPRRAQPSAPRRAHGDLAMGLQGNGSDRPAHGCVLVHAAFRVRRCACLCNPGMPAILSFQSSLP